MDKNPLLSHLISILTLLSMSTCCMQIIRSHKYLHLGNIKEQARQLQWIGLTWFGLVVIVIIAVITAWSRGWFIKKRNKKCLISR